MKAAHSNSIRMGRAPSVPVSPVLCRYDGRLANHHRTHHSAPTAQVEHVVRSNSSSDWPDTCRTTQFLLWTSRFLS